MGKLGMVNRILLLVALLVCNAYGGSTVMLTAILPINKDINAPLATAQVVAAIDMGIEAVNQQHIINSSFGVTLSVSFRDDQGSTKLALQETVRAATESPTKGIIGGYYSSTCEVISIVADEYGIPQVSGSATISDLSDKSFYPMFARTVPPDNEQAITIARLITLYGWSNVGVLYTTDLYATGMQQNFQIACGQAGINLLAQEQFATGGQLSVVKTLLSVIQQRNIKIIVLFMQSNDALTVFQGASDLEMLDADHAWIGSDSLESLDIPSNLTHKLQGFMYTVATTSNGSNYNQFEQQLLARVPSPRSQYAASYYDIVFVYAYAINALLTRHGSYYDFNGTELYNAILAVEFNGASRHIQFNANGDSYPALYSIYNFQNVSFVDVGLLSPNSTVPPKAIFFGGTNPPSDDVRVNIINIALMLPFSTFENEITYKSAIAYVIDQLNAQNFVPNYTLVLISEDDKNNPGIGIVNAVYLADKGIPLLLGSDSSSVTKPIASVMSNLQIPQLSFISTSPELSDKGTYPYFLRNVPSDNAQTIAMASILKNFGWTRVITVNTVEAYGSAAVQAFNNATKSYGITSIYGASFQVGQLDLSGIMQDIAKQDATIIVTFVSYDDCPKFYSEVKRAGLMVSPYVWINSDTCSSWGRSFNASAFDEDPSLGEAMKGMLGVIAHSGGGQVYTDWVAEMASLKPDEYPGLSDVASVVYTSQSYDMMHLVATALRNMVLVGADYTDGPTLLSYLKNTTYQGLTGLNEFNSDGDRISDYDLLSWASTNSTQYSVVGLWQVADSKLSIFNQLSWLGTDLTYPSYIPPDRIPPSPEKKNSNNKIIIILASVLGFLLLAAIALIAFFLMRRRKIHIQEKEKIPALIWEDEPLLGASAGSDNSPMLTASPSVSSDVARFIPTNGIDINKVDLTFGLSKGDRFPVDKKLRDQVEITNTSNSVKKFRVYVPADVSRFRCQVYPGTGELRKNETLTFEIKFTLLLTTHINRKIKIEIDDNAPIYLSMNFKGDVSDKIDLDEIDIKGEPIGEGGFGTVYRGRFRGTEVAVKIAHSRNEHIKSFMNEFMREIDMMRRLHHPNITTFIGASFVPGKTGIVTEYCKRGSLAKLIHSGKSIPYGLKIKIAQDIANGVSFLHENGVLHRDLKPDNVLLASTNYMEQVCAKLTDFGTAKSVDQHTLNFAHTQGLGTPIYMSPEILQRKQYSTKVDVFSFGVLLWELYTQLHPFHFIKLHWNIPAFVLAGNRNPIPPDCPPELENLINRCWAAEADDRPTFQQIGETLDRIYQPLKKQEKVKSALGKLNREDDENGSSNSSPSSSPHPTNTGASIVHPTITSDSSVSHSHANVTSNSTAVFHPSISSNSAAVHPSATVKEYLREIELETVHNTNSNNNAL